MRFKNTLIANQTSLENVCQSTSIRYIYILHCYLLPDALLKDELTRSKNMANFKFYCIWLTFHLLYLKQWPLLVPQISIVRIETRYYFL